MLHHHHKLATEGAQAEGLIMQSERTAEEGHHKLLIGVKFDDGQVLEFEEKVSEWVRIPEHIRKQFGLAHDDDLVILWLSNGDRIPVRYNEANRSQIMVDIATMHQQAIEKHVQAKVQRRSQLEQQLRNM